MIAALRKEGVEVRGDEETRKIVPDVKAATEQDWYTEYLDLIMGVKVVKNLDEAIAHINKYGTKHSDAILTADFDKAMKFIQEIDSAAVYWNASTRFTDGNQFGLRRRNRHQHPKTSCTRTHERPAFNNNKIRYFRQWTNQENSSLTTHRYLTKFYFFIS